MRIGFALLLSVLVMIGAEPRAVEGEAGTKKVAVVPVRDDIFKPMVYLVRRGVKEAIAQKADLLIVDMDTNGGRVDSTEEIIEILSEFQGPTVTYVNKKAYSAGAFISVSTGTIYMAPQSRIGAAAPIMLAPGGGAQDIPGTMEVKVTSALSASVRAQAEKHGHNKEVVQAMIDKNAELRVGEEVLCKSGDLLTLTDVEAATQYVMEEGEPARPLLSAGTVESLDALIEQLGFGDAERLVIKTTGMEELATWLMAIGPLLLIVGAVGLYIEFKTPGFGLPGIVGIAAFALYFFGGYAAGLSGMEWVVVFVLGLALVAIELFVFPGTIVVGLVGAGMMFAAIIMALVDLYPNPGPGPGLPALPSFKNPFVLPLRTLLLAILGTGAAVWLLSRWLPKTSVYNALVLQKASGMETEVKQQEMRTTRLGQEGVTISALRPGGKIQIGDEILDVTSQGDFVEVGTRVRIVAYRNNVPVIETV